MGEFSIVKSAEKLLRGLVAGVVVAVASWAAKNHMSLEKETVDALTVGLTGVALGALAFLTNVLKHKFPKLFGWL